MRRGSTVLFALHKADLDHWEQRTLPKGAPGAGDKGEGTRQRLSLLLFPFVAPQLSRWFPILFILPLMCCPHQQNHRGMGTRTSACVHTGTHLQVFRDVTSVYHQESEHGFDRTSETNRACCTKAVNKLGPHSNVICGFVGFFCHSPTIAACS